MFVYSFNLYDVSTYSAGNMALAQAGLGIFLPILIFCISGVAVISAYILAPQWFETLFEFFSELYEAFKTRRSRKIKKTEDILKESGFLYDEKQDAFYSALNAWQRKYGYCRLYDEAAALSGIVIDCEPIPFEYQGKKWLIEFWKGQYGMTCGGEIGVFSTENPALSVSGLFNGIFYQSAEDSEMLQMSFSLLKNNKVILTRKDLHWWLTGFKLFEFSSPSDLRMDMNLVLKTEEMATKFVDALILAGYRLGVDLNRVGQRVSVIFDTPHTAQVWPW